MAEETQPQAVQDAWILRLVVITFALILLAAVGGIFVLPLFDKETPPELSNLALMILGILSAILTPLGAKAITK